MTEPASSTAAGAVLLSGALAGALTRQDYWTLLGGFAGALLAMRNQAPRGAISAITGLLSVVVFALALTWLFIDVLPAAVAAAGQTMVPVIGRGRMALSWLIGYYAQSTLLPLGAQLIGALAARLGKWGGSK